MRKMLLAALVFALASVAHAQGGHSVTLSWLASTSPNVTYNVYRGTVSGGPYSQINTAPVNALTFLDSGVSNGTTYFYVVRSYDGTVESANSNQVSAVIPPAPAPPTSVTAIVK